MAEAAWPLPYWIAHRGAGKLAPENTLAAFRVGAGHGYRAFECDVKLSADGVPFLLHDATLERTTALGGLAGERSWSELSRVDAGSWHSPAYAGEPIPSFEAIAAYVRRNGHALDIEIKPTPGQELATGRTLGLEVMRLWEGAQTLPLFTSFRPDALQGALETAPQVPRGLLLDTLWEGWERAAATLVVYPQPFGVTAEYGIGRGPEFDPATNSIRSQRLEGGFVQLSYRVLQDDQVFLPFVRLHKYDGGKKVEQDARSYDVREIEAGVEWTPFSAFELAVQSTWSNRRFEDASTIGNRQRGQFLRIQAQFNY
jgi:glycerophosphoryl diester phosphodiesterase